jgi:SsrA-binding protein
MERAANPALSIFYQSNTSDILEVMANKKKPSPPKAVLNRRARFDYELGDEITAGLVLTGPEVRAARDGHIQLKGSFVTSRNDELWLNNASFSLRHNKKSTADARTIDTSPRKLLAGRKQIDTLLARKKDGMTIVPTKLLTNGRFIKVVIALGKGKKRYDKRETLKRRDQERDAERAIKHA